MFSISLLFFVSSLVSLLAFLFVSTKRYAKYKNERYNFANYFPYELRISISYSDNPFGNSLFILSNLLSAGFYISLLSFNYTGIDMAIVCSGVLLSLFNIGVYFYPLNNLKSHILMFSLEAVFSLAITILNSYKFISSQLDEPNNIKLIFCILYSLLALFVLGLIANPKLSFNLKMETTSENEQKRPKCFVLAVSEWLLMLLPIIYNLLILIDHTI